MNIFIKTMCLLTTMSLVSCGDRKEECLESMDTGKCEADLNGKYKKDDKKDDTSSDNDNEVNNSTDPDVTDPDVTDPDVTDPDVTDPDVTDPDVTDPDVTDPDVTDPDVTDPDVTDPDVTDPDTNHNLGYTTKFVLQNQDPVEKFYYTVEFILPTKIDSIEIKDPNQIITMCKVRVKSTVEQSEWSNFQERDTNLVHGSDNVLKFKISDVIPSENVKYQFVCKSEGEVMNLTEDDISVIL